MRLETIFYIVDAPQSGDELATPLLDMPDLGKSAKDRFAPENDVRHPCSIISSVRASNVLVVRSRALSRFEIDHQLEARSPLCPTAVSLAATCEPET